MIEPIVTNISQHTDISNRFYFDKTINYSLKKLRNIIYQKKK